ncbi:unnamed protein product, partial [Polarella glacialis]
DPGSTAPPAAASLAAAPPAKQMIGEMLYPRIAKLQPELAGQITGMMLELDNSELLILLESDAQLKGKVDEALREYNSANNNAGNDKNNNNSGNNNNNNVNDNDFASTNNNQDNDNDEVMPGDSKSTPDQNARGQQPQQPQQQQEQQEQKPQLERQKQHDVLTNGLDVATTPPGGTSTLPVAAGSEAAQAASECPALAEERFELEFFCRGFC